MKKEIWKDIVGYEGYYQASSIGRVKTLDKYVNGKNGSIRFIKGKILKPLNNEKGYLFVNLYKDGICKHMRVHRLVAETFIPNDDPVNKTQVNHIDEDKTNNCVENLEWCTNEYNSNYGSRNKKLSEKLINGKGTRPILQFDLNNNLIMEWVSASEASRQLGITKGQSNISKCCRGLLPTAYGYKWEYKEAI